RSVILGAEDRLAHLTTLEELDQEPRPEQGDQRRDRAGDHHRDHWLPPSPVSPAISRRTSRTTARSSNGRTSSPTVCVVSWPLPATTTTSPGRAAARAVSIACRRSISTITASRSRGSIPATIAST